MKRKEKKRRIEQECVTLLAAGYEWYCPRCTEVDGEGKVRPNTVYQVPKSRTVTCRNCGRTYPVEDAEHAYE